MAVPRPDPERERWAVIASHLHRLISTPEWDLFVAQIREMERGSLEELATATSDVRYLQGKIQGIREVLRWPELTIARTRRP